MLSGAIMLFMYLKTIGAHTRSGEPPPTYLVSVDWNTPLAVMIAGVVLALLATPLAKLIATRCERDEFS